MYATTAIEVMGEEGKGDLYRIHLATGVVHRLLVKSEKNHTYKAQMSVPHVGLSDSQKVYSTIKIVAAYNIHR